MKSITRNSKTIGRSSSGVNHRGAFCRLNRHSDYCVVQARYLGQWRVWLRFEDDLEGEVDLADELDGPVFLPLKDPAYFESFAIDHTLTWANGADFAPEFLYDLVLKSRKRRKAKAPTRG